MPSTSGSIRLSGWTWPSAASSCGRPVGEPARRVEQLQVRPQPPGGDLDRAAGRRAGPAIVDGGRIDAASLVERVHRRRARPASSASQRTDTSPAGSASSPAASVVTVEALTRTSYERGRAPGVVEHAQDAVRWARTGRARATRRRRSPTRCRQCVADELDPRRRRQRDPVVEHAPTNATVVGSRSRSPAVSTKSSSGSPPVVTGAEVEGRKRGEPAHTSANRERQRRDLEQGGHTRGARRRQRDAAARAGDRGAQRDRRRAASGRATAGTRLWLPRGGRRRAG